MSEHTPTTEQVRGRHNANAMFEPLTWRQADAQFDRWLAEEIRKAQVEALSEATPRLFTALEAVLAVHEPEVLGVHEGYGEEVWCPVCRAHYPCKTVQIVEEALGVTK